MTNDKHEAAYYYGGRGGREQIPVESYIVTVPFEPEPKRRWWAPQDYTWGELGRFWGSALLVGVVLGAVAAMVIP